MGKRTPYESSIYFALVGAKFMPESQPPPPLAPPYAYPPAIPPQGAAVPAGATGGAGGAGGAGGSSGSQTAGAALVGSMNGIHSVM